MNSDPYWSPLQCIAWIIARDIELVSQLARDTRSEKATNNLTPEYVVNLIKQKGNLESPKWISAERQLILQLQSGALICFGRESCSDAICEIAPEAWLSLFFEYAPLHGATSGNFLKTDKITWYHLRILRDSVMKIWTTGTSVNSPDLAIRESPVRVSDDGLNSYLLNDYLTALEAVFLFFGYEPRNSEHWSEELRFHFPVVSHYLNRAFRMGSLGRRIGNAGSYDYIDTPQKWYEWLTSKGMELDPRIHVFFSASTGEIESMARTRDRAILKEASDIANNDPEMTNTQIAEHLYRSKKYKMKNGELLSKGTLETLLGKRLKRR